MYDHSSAFGQWGPLFVELTQVHDAQPAGLRDSLVAPGGGVGHVAWLADSLEDEVARLRHAGITPFHAGRTGPASAVWFDGGEHVRPPDRGAPAPRRVARVLRDGARGGGRVGRFGAAADHDRGTRMNHPPTRSTSSWSASAPPARPRRSPRTSRRAVAVVEKTASGGGNCVHSGGFLFDVDGPRAVDHLDALCFGKTDRTVLEA